VGFVLQRAEKDLDAVKAASSKIGVQGSVEHALQDDLDGRLDGAAVGHFRKLETGTTWRVLRPGMEVATRVAAQGGRAAADAVGFDVVTESEWHEVGPFVRMTGA